MAKVSFAQTPVRMEALTSFSWGANKSLIGKTIIEDGSQISESQRNISFGGGNEFGLLLSKGFDSSNFTVSLGFSIFSGNKNLINSYKNTDSGSHEYNVAESFQASILLGIGYSKSLGEKFEINTDVGLYIPFSSRLREEKIVEKSNYWEQSTIKYSTTYLPGFWFRGGLAYKVNNNLSLRSNVFFTFMNLSERKSVISNYSSSNGETLNNRYPSVSDRETIYYSDISKVSNDPILFPDTFDPNKPSESIKSQLPFSRIGLSFSVVWHLNVKSRK